MFIHFDNRIVNSDTIKIIDCANLITSGYIRICYKDSRIEIVNGPEAFTIVMELCPGALEGKQAEYARHAWAVHNLIGHPLMQIFSWLHLTSFGIKIHDATVPNPKVLE